MHSTHALTSEFRLSYSYFSELARSSPIKASYWYRNALTPTLLGKNKRVGRHETQEMIPNIKVPGFQLPATKPLPSPDPNAFLHTRKPQPRRRYMTGHNRRQFNSRWISNCRLIFWGGPISPKVIPQTKSDMPNTNLDSERSLVFSTDRQIHATEISRLVFRGIPI